MLFKPRHLAEMEDYGYTDTSTGLINWVARQLANSPNDNIGAVEFSSARIACNVDPDSFTNSDLEQRAIRTFPGQDARHLFGL